MGHHLVAKQLDLFLLSSGFIVYHKKKHEIVTLVNGSTETRKVEKPTKLVEILPFVSRSY